MIALTDSHAHIDVTAFAADRDAVIARARAAGVMRQIVPSISASGWPALAALCRCHEGLHAAYGLHPMALAEHREEHLTSLPACLVGQDAVAVGECGLDYSMQGLDPAWQSRCFDAQLTIARDLRLPVIVHARRALDAVIGLLRRARLERGGVVHSFSGSPEQARRLWALGFHLGIGGPLTYPRAQRLRHLVATMPAEFLLLETDSPDQPDHDWRGQRNEPARLRRVLTEAALLRDESEARLAAITDANAARLFGLRVGAPAAG